MITDRITLVLGAGASMPYGFPLGERLLNIICNQLKSPIDPKWALHLNHHRHSKKKIQEFADALSKSGRFSVDEFLARVNPILS